MTRLRSMRLVCSGFWADVRPTEPNARWLASADTPDGPRLGVAWSPIDGFVDELLATLPADLAWR